VTPELLRVLAVLVFGVTAYETIAVGVPEARAIGLGLLLAALLLAWIEWRPIAGGPEGAARRRRADRATITRQAADRDLARLTVLTVVIAEAGLLLSLLRPIAAAPVAAAVALSLAIAIVAIGIASALPSAYVGRGRRMTGRQVAFGVGGTSIALCCLVTLVGSLTWPASVGTVPARAEALAAAASTVLVLLPAVFAAPASWRWPGLAILGTGAAAALAALLAWPIITSRPEIAVASVVAAASVAMVAAAIVLGTPREPERLPATRAASVRTVVTVVITAGLLLAFVVADWGLRHAR
jgi:hypothetical protein